MRIEIFKDKNELSKSVADWMVKYVAKKLSYQKFFSLVLSGGNTPQKLYKLLASENYKTKIDWSKMQIFFGDERFVSFGDERNNAGEAFKNLLNYVSVPASQIHIMQTENTSPEDSAKNYEILLRQYFQGNQTQQTTNLPTGQTGNKQQTTFDLVLLGMGDEGHTLSLFPNYSPIIHETEKWCVAFWLESQKMYRITLTHQIINNSSAIAFLVSGESKANALYEVLKGNYNPDAYPSQIIKPSNEKLYWFVDEEAAKLI